jgi:DNA-binding NtrC family response regulator
MEAKMATILIVDDEPMILNLITTILKERGHSIITAGSAGEAIDKVRNYSKKIDLLISDISMPEMDGVSLASELQSRDEHMKVLLMSGGCNRVKVPAYYEFLPKPFVIADIISKVDRLSGQPAVRVSAAA